MSDIILGRTVGEDNAAAFAHSAAANTQVTIDIPNSTIFPSPRDRCVIEVYNPSTVTDLTIKIFAKALALGAGTRYALIDTVTIPKSQTITGTTINAYLKIIEGMFVGEDLRLVVSNDTILGAAEGFTAYVRVREV